MAHLNVKDLKPGDVVWESCPSGNTRLVVMTEPKEENNSWWECECKDDFGNEMVIAHNTTYNQSDIYKKPMYLGVPWHCKIENIPEGQR